VAVAIHSGGSRGEPPGVATPLLWAKRGEIAKGRKDSWANKTKIINRKK